MSKQLIKVVVSGACGKMGRETAKAVAGAEDMSLVGVCDVSAVGQSYAKVSGAADDNLVIRDDLAALVDELRPDAVVDFTAPASAMGNIRIILERGVSAIIGTTGITKEDLKEIGALADKNSAAAAIIPNFAIGAVLMMKFAADAARYLPMVEIVELHHDKKIDSPSGTSIKTAEMISSARDEAGFAPPPPIDGATARGFDASGVRIHSVRLQGLVAHQEVIFGGQGQTLTIRHDSIDRTSFMPGVLLAIRKMQDVKGLIYGLENLL